MISKLTFPIIVDCLLPRHGYGCGIFVSKTKVDQEDDADGQHENTNCKDFIGDSDAADHKEEDTADKVDEELELREAAASDVVEEDAGDDDGIADDDSLQEVIGEQNQHSTVLLGQGSRHPHHQTHIGSSCQI